MGTLDGKWGPFGDPKTEKGPHGDPGPQMGAHVGAVAMMIEYVLACPLLGLNHSGSHWYRKVLQSPVLGSREKSLKGPDYKTQAPTQRTLRREPSWLASERKVPQVDALQNFTSLQQIAALGMRICNIG